MSIKTINLTGSEQSVEISGANCAVRNDGTAVVYASAAPNITAGADGVLSIPVGGSAVLLGHRGTLYLLGTGSVQLMGSDRRWSGNPFKTVSASGGSGADEVARAAIEAHSGNADIHVTAADKSAWYAKADTSDIPDISGKADSSALTSHTGDADIHVTAEEKNAWSSKADLSDIPEIPTSLPANGGNADTLDGKHATAFTHTAATWTEGDFHELAKSAVSCNLVVQHTVTNMPYAATWVASIVSVSGTVYATAARVGNNDWYQCSCHGVTKDWTEWKLIKDGGNAATLEAHPASDFVLKSEYEALAARVAALEGGA